MLFLLQLLFVFTGALAQVEDLDAVIPLEHMLPGDDKWSSRGYIAINSLRAQAVSYVQDEQLSREELKLLRCGIVESGLSEVLTLCMDGSNSVIGVSVVTVPPHCTGAHNPLSNTGVFNTSVEIERIEQGPTPDTTSYLQKLEQEKIAKQRGESKDNRSFFAKYWMYIVPVVLIMMLSNSGQPEQGGGGGR